MSATSSPLSDPPPQSPSPPSPSRSPSSASSAASSSHGSESPEEHPPAKAKPKRVMSSEDDDDVENFDKIPHPKPRQDSPKKGATKGTHGVPVEQKIIERKNKQAQLADVPSPEPALLQSKTTTKQRNTKVTVTTTTKTARPSTDRGGADPPEKKMKRDAKDEQEKEAARKTEVELREKAEQQQQQHKEPDTKKKEDAAHDCPGKPVSKQGSSKSLDSSKAKPASGEKRKTDEESKSDNPAVPHSQPASSTHSTPKNGMDVVKERKERHARQVEEKQQQQQQKEAEKAAKKDERMDLDEPAKPTISAVTSSAPTPLPPKPKSAKPTPKKDAMPSFKKNKAGAMSTKTSSPSVSGSATPTHMEIGSLFKLTESGVDVKASQAAKREREARARGEDEELRKRKEEYMRNLDHELENSTMHNFMDDRDTIGEWEKGLASSGVPYPYANCMAMYGIDWFKYGPPGFSKEAIDKFNRENLL